MLIRPALREYRNWFSDSRRWNGYKPRPGDIVVATAPKCGTTWMQRIVCLLIFQDTRERPLPVISPWIDARFRQSEAEMYDAIQAQPHRRFIKTHLGVDGVPLYDEVRYIHVARDGRDAALSYHNHATGFSDSQLQDFDRIGLDDPAIGRPYPRAPSHPDEYLRYWLTHVGFFDLVRSYWAERRRPNFLLVHYNDLKRNLDAEMRRVAAFLDIEVDEKIWKLLVIAAGFEAMRAAGDQLMPYTKRMFVEGSRRFFNKGVSGRGREVFDEDMLALYDSNLRGECSPSLAAWLEHGRLGAGDPRDATD
jgi:aryl sulfotransferase